MAKVSFCHPDERSEEGSPQSSDWWVCHPCAGRGASNLDENESPTKKRTLPLSFLRKRGPRKVPQATAEDTLWGQKQESIEKV
ncbi:MAG: hypothetical protein AAF471_03080, partial [Myxococcota bacterium]